MSENAETTSSDWIRRSNEEVAEPGKFEFFLESICSTFTGIRPERTSNRSFQAVFTALSMPGMELAHIAAPGHRARRDRHLIASRPDDSIFINFEPHRACGVRFPDASFLVPRASPLVLDNDSGFALDFDAAAPMDLFSLRLDRAFLPFELPASRLPEINRRARTSETGHMLARQFMLLGRAMRQGNARLCGAMAVSVRELLDGLVVQRPDERRVPDLSVIKDVARDHLADPAFGITDIASRLGCSIRTVQSRFNEAGDTFSEWLQNARLELAESMLCDPSCAFRTISAIAHRSGFADIPHFNRAYRRHFGMTPGDRRKTAIATDGQEIT